MMLENDLGTVGSGNYTEERDSLLSGITLDDIAESIQRREKNNVE